MGFIGEWIQQTWQVLLQAGTWLVAGFLLAGFIHVLVPVDKVTRHLGKPGFAGVLKAALLGAPLPLCSCSVIPIASAIRRQGATRGATASFLVSTPETGVDSIAFSYAMLGPFMAIVRLSAAVISAIIAGLAIDRWGESETRQSHPVAPTSPVPASSCGHKSASCDHETDAATDGQEKPATDCCSTGHSHTAAVIRPSLPARVTGGALEALRYGFGRMFEDLAHWLAIGFILAGLVATLFPPDLLERSIGADPWTLLLMLVIGLPMYVCASTSTPVAAVLIAKGLSPGAALVFLLAGPATNAATMVIVGRDLGRRSLAIYLISIAVIAVLFGWATNALLNLKPILAESIHQHVHAEPAGTAWPFAVLLMLLIINGLRMRITTYLATTQHDHTAATPAHTCCEHH